MFVCIYIYIYTHSYIIFQPQSAPRKCLWPRPPLAADDLALREGFASYAHELHVNSRSQRGESLSLSIKWL